MIDSVFRASDLLSTDSPSQQRSASELCWDAVSIISRSVTVISGHASTSVSCAVLRQFQIATPHPIPWVVLGGTLPYLPDLISLGINTDSILWIKAPTKRDVLDTVDTLLGHGAFPFLCADLSDLTGIEASYFSRFMHRCRQWNTTVLFVVLTPAGYTPSPAIRFHIDVESRDRSALLLKVRRSFLSLADGVCDVKSPFPLS